MALKPHQTAEQYHCNTGSNAIIADILIELQVYCVNWNVVRRNTFLTGSWDDTIKLWDLNSPQSLATFKEHTYCVYAATW